MARKDFLRCRSDRGVQASRPVAEFDVDSFRDALALTLAHGRNDLSAMVEVCALSPPRGHLLECSLAGLAWLLATWLGEEYDPPIGAEEVLAHLALRVAEDAG